MESDAPLTKEQIEKIRVEASAPDVQEGLVSMIPNEVRALCTLALRGLEAERVREETLEEAAQKIERMLAPDDEACRENATLKLSIKAIRALKKGHSDAKSA